MCGEQAQIQTVWQPEEMEEAEYIAQNPLKLPVPPPLSPLHMLVHWSAMAPSAAHSQKAGEESLVRRDGLVVNMMGVVTLGELDTEKRP